MKFFIFILSIVSTSLFAAQDAIIRSEHAIIYADIEMTAPIGYVSQGKKVRIGNTTKTLNRLYPIVVNNKIAYIKKEDLTLKSEATMNLKTRFKEGKYVYKNNSYGLGLIGTMTSINFSLTHDKMKNENLNFMGITANKTQTLRKNSHYESYYLNYKKAESTTQHFSELALAYERSWLVFESDIINVKPKLGASISPYVNYEIPGIFSKRAYGFGAYLGLDLSKMVSRNFESVFSTSYSYSRYMGLDLPAPYPSTSATLMGFDFSMRLQYFF